MNKRIVICCDGTWNTPDQKQDGVYNPTNVVKMARAVAPTGDDGRVQVVFYDSGVGTGAVMDKLFGGAFGAGLSQNVIDGYRFLVHNFEPGDDIFLFGFSRGAYTARSIAGMIRNCGILKPEHAERIDEAFELYRRQDAPPDCDEAVDFRNAWAVETPIHFIGVWDTVGALGIPGGLSRSFNKKKFEFHDVQLSSRVSNAFHALAIDERRSSFKPTLWRTRPGAEQRVEQMWFPGVHSDVGGGYVETDLSDRTFMWMQERAQESGLAFLQDYVARIHGNPAGELHNSRTGFYRVMKSYVRPIGRTVDAGETVHTDAFERLRKVLDYEPENLLEYENRLQEHLDWSDDGASRAVRKSVTVNGALPDVWDAWTTREGCASFFAPDCRIDLRVGGAYEIYFTPDAKSDRGGEGCTILAVQPQRLLSFTWNAPPEMPEIRAQFTHVSVYFQAVSEKTTLVSLVHDGWGAGELWDRAFNYFDKAWGDIVLPRLQRRFDYGPIDWQNPDEMPNSQRI